MLTAHSHHHLERLLVLLMAWLPTQARSSCYEACKTSAASLRNAQQTLNACRIAARCLFFRQLLSKAAQAELEAQVPAVSGALAGTCSVFLWRWCIVLTLGLRPMHCSTVEPLEHDGLCSIKSSCVCVAPSLPCSCVSHRRPSARAGKAASQSAVQLATERNQASGHRHHHGIARSCLDTASGRYDLHLLQRAISTSVINQRLRCVERHGESIRMCKLVPLTVHDSGHSWDDDWWANNVVNS